MKLLLVPDPTSPYGEDAFCREIAKRAAARSHNAKVWNAGEPVGECDAVVINSLQPEALAAAKSAGRRVAVRLIDTFANQPAASLEEKRRLALTADMIMVPSKYLAGIVSAWGANGGVRQVPYAYDRIMAQQIALVTIRATKPAFQLVAAGVLDEASRAGLETLMAAVGRLRIDCHLAIVGEGPAEAALKARAAQSGLGARVNFLGVMPHPKLMEFFRASKAYVDPCGLDGFPALALHALSEGCPVIAARAGAIPELINDRKNGLLFSPGEPATLAEAIMTLFSERGYSLRLIEQGIKTVEVHSWDATVAALFDAVETLK